MLAGVHRARHLAKHLPAAGWTPVVLCVDEAYHEQRLDPALATLVPASVEVVKVPALSPRICRPLGLGEISLRAWRPLRRTLLSLIATRQVSAVLITGSPYYPMLLAGEIKRRFGVPVVLDFQDPWVSAWGAKQPRLSKSGVSHRLSVFLEPKALRAANFITSVSDTQNAEMAARYPWLDRSRMVAIPIGGDPDDYEALRTMRFESSAFVLEPGYIHLSYVGTIWPSVMDTLWIVLRAAALVRSQRADIYTRLRLNFIGTTENPAEPQGRWVSPLAETLGVADIVREVPQRLPYLQSLSLQANSDAILLIGSNEAHYTASKIYGAMMSGRPYLSIFHQASSSHEILRRAGGGIALGFANAGELDKLVSNVASALIQLAVVPRSVGRADPQAYEAYTAARVTQDFANIIERLTLTPELVP